MQYLYFPADFHSLNRLEHFDDDVFVTLQLNSAENFRVTTAAKFHRELVIVLWPEQALHVFVVGIIDRLLLADIGVEFWWRYNIVQIISVSRISGPGVHIGCLLSRLSKTLKLVE